MSHALVAVRFARSDCPALRRSGGGLNTYGVVAQVLVQPGQRVAAGQPLASVEAMKMEMWLGAAAAGSVRAVHVAPGHAVDAGALLVELDLDDAPQKEA